MVRLILRLMLILLLLSSMGITAVRLLAYDAAYFAGLRTALLASPGCQDKICYRGIRPGGTTMRAAQTLLREQVENVQAEYLQTSPTNPYMILWEEASTYFPQGHIEAQSGIALVDFVWLPSSATLGELWLAFGVPRSLTLYGKFQVMRYPTFSVHTDVMCRHFWEEKAGIIITSRLTQERGIDLIDVRRAVCSASGYR